MASIPQVAQTMQTVLGPVAEAAARAHGFIRRRGKVTGANFVQTLVFGWLAQPAASLSQLTHMAAACGLEITPQGLDDRFTEAAATYLQRVLEAAMRQVVTAEPVAVPILERFNGVYVWDSTTITLPDALAAIWPGCGGRVATNTRAALKLQVRWNLTTGALEWLDLHDGRGSDRAAADRATPLPAGALRLTDLGYVSLVRLTALTAQRVAVLCRLPAHVAVFDAAGRRWSAAALLAAQGTDTVDLPVTLGVAERVPVRVVARRVAPAVAAQRRRQWRKAATRAGQTPSRERLALADWDVFITTVPSARLAAEEALVLMRARWQIELLFKLWKSQGQVDEWRSQNPWRILCEVYAKLLAMLVQHWCLLLRCWADPARSLVKAAAVVRRYALLLALARGHRPRLRVALARLGECLASAGHLASRKGRPATARAASPRPPPPGAAAGDRGGAARRLA